MMSKAGVRRLERRAGVGNAATTKPSTTAPVDPKRFIESPYFMNAKGKLYPVVLEAFIELNSGNYCEAVLTGGIGCGKTTIALYTTAYQLYLMSCLENLHERFSLDSTSEIVFIFQSITSELAESVDYRRFKEMIDLAPYFRNHFRYDKSTARELRFPYNIVVRPVSGRTTAAIGQNVIGGVIDEVNYMAVVQRSQQSVDGGAFDQAWASYNSVSRRRKSRFMQDGELPGMLCLVSSKRYPGQFTDIKTQEAENEKATSGTSAIYVYDKRAWEIRPSRTFSGKWFLLHIGDHARMPRILKDKETISPEDQLLVIKIPEEFRSDFERDIVSAVRDIAGVSAVGRHPFFVDRGKLAEAFGTTTSILSRDCCDFVTADLSICREQLRLLRRSRCLKFRRFAHVDLALTNDSAGIACGYVVGFSKVRRGDLEYEFLPQIVFDFLLEVPPPPNGEINFERIRTLFYDLRNAGIPLKWISMDSYQSKDMEQILRQKGFCTGIESIDRSSVPYDFTKSAIIDGRVSLPQHTKAHQELVQLERDPVKGKIDHPPNGSKDLADAVAGVVYGLTQRREIWAMHKVRPSPQLIGRLQRASQERELAEL